MKHLRTLLLIATLAATNRASAQGVAPAADTLVSAGNAFMQAKQYAEAAKVFAQLAQRQPSQPAYWTRLGVAQQLAGDRDGALASYRKGIQLGAGAVAQYNVGTLFALRGMPDSAFHWLTASIGAGFSNLSALESDQDLAALHADSRWLALVDTVKRAASPCMYRPESRAFDFWVGEWDVTNAAGQPAGKSSVQLLLNGCALYENWSTGGNGDGKSLNSYNAALNMWQQFWTDQTGRVTEYRTSAWIGSSLQYTARVTSPKPQLLHMTFTPVNKDLVRQHGEVSVDDGKTWTTQYDLYYHRRG